MIPYGFSAEDFGRVARSVRRSEGLPPRRDQQTPGPSGGIAAPHNWIYVTSTTLQTITLTNGTWQGYSAIWGYPDSDSGEWVQTANQVWFLTPNGETPTADTWIKAHCIGADANGQTIWAADIASNSTIVSGETNSAVASTQQFASDVEAPFDFSNGFLPFIPPLSEYVEFNDTQIILLQPGFYVISITVVGPGPYAALLQGEGIFGGQTVNGGYANVTGIAMVSQGSGLSLELDIFQTTGGFTSGYEVAFNFLFVGALSASSSGGGGGGGTSGGGVGVNGIFGANGITIAPNAPAKNQVTIGIGTIDCGTWV